MKRFLRIYSVLCILIALALYRYHFSRTHSELEKIRFCKGSTSPLNYVGSSLISNSFDSEDLVFCPGDYFGDLNNTYVIVKNCYLEMYHQEKLIWSSTPNSYYGGNIGNSEYACALSLQRDGNVVLYREGAISVNPMGIKIAIFPQWESQTSLSPLKTELKVKDQQVQIQQTFRNGKERLFYVGEENQTFKEDMGEPKKIANKFVLKKSEEKDKTILLRNEYIGNLNDTYLILQTNCELQLLNKDKIPWSITSKFRHEMNCALTTNERNQVVISKIHNHQQKTSESQKIMLSDDDLNIVENRITFEDDQPMISQTLKNGSNIIFTPGVGANNAFKPKREPRQLAKKTLHVARDDESFDTIERMDYVGNFTGLHLILEQNCSLMLVNGNEKLWELQPHVYEDSLLECFIRFDDYANIVLKRQSTSFSGGGFGILRTYYNDRDFVAGFQLTLENNQLIIIRKLTNRAPDVFLAGPNTHGSLLQLISESSVVVNGDDKEDLVLLTKGFIGDINGLYVTFEEDCNWVLYNKTQVIWESGTSRNIFDRECALLLTRNGSVIVTSQWLYQRENNFWSTQDITSNSEKEVLRTKLFVDDSGLWLINYYADGVEKRFQALEGTNNFIQKSSNIEN